MTQFLVPIAFLVFNRPETTARVFEEIRRIRPLKLLVVADGPRNNHPGDAGKCAEVRSIIDSVDWPCEVLKNYSDENLGCGLRPASGITWVFEHVEEAIILEDDCLPHPSFFYYCQELLQKYRDDNRIMVIAGNNQNLSSSRGSNSYYFSMYPYCWGWASWRRAWNYFDFDMKLLPHVFEDHVLENIFLNKSERSFWIARFNSVFSQDKSHIWDYQWFFACCLQGGLCVVPNVTLVSNIGFGEGATHTTDGNNVLANLPTEEMKFPLNHPYSITRDVLIDKKSFESFLGVKSLYARLINKVKRLILTNSKS